MAAEFFLNSTIFRSFSHGSGRNDSTVTRFFGFKCGAVIRYTHNRLSSVSARIRCSLYRRNTGMSVYRILSIT